ncbi:MAG: hypothetical protein KY475_27055, partial [Planctomycetes bacterium]|nr:hypothetical protein [Planctomycetota bacterium]
MIRKLARSGRRPSPWPNSKEDPHAAAPRTVLVTDAGRGSALAIIRSLGRAGYRVVPGDSDRRSPGFRSRYADAPVVYPSPAEAPAAFVEGVVHAVREREIGLLIPVTDEAILPLSKANSRLPLGCRLATPDAEALQAVCDKHRTWELARQLDIPAPQTRLVHHVEEALDAATQLRWPVVLKPQVSRRLEDRGAVAAFRVAYANDRAGLEQQMRQFEGRCAVLL